MKFFGLYSAIILLGFAAAAHEGYAMSSLFGQHHHGKPGGHGYYGHGSSSFYHK